MYKELILCIHDHFIIENNLISLGIPLFRFVEFISRRGNNVYV